MVAIKTRRLDHTEDYGLAGTKNEKLSGDRTRYGDSNGVLKNFFGPLVFEIPVGLIWLKKFFFAKFVLNR